MTRLLLSPPGTTADFDKLEPIGRRLDAGHPASLPATGMRLSDRYRPTHIQCAARLR